MGSPEQLAQHSKWEEATAEVREQLAELKRPKTDGHIRGIVKQFPADVQDIYWKPGCDRNAYEEQLAQLVQRQVDYKVQRIDWKKDFAKDKARLKKYTELAESENPAAGESGIYYRMPVMATVKIVDELNTISTARMPIAQFGVVAPLPEKVVNGVYMVKFHPETGAIKSVYRR